MQPTNLMFAASVPLPMPPRTIDISPTASAQENNDRPTQARQGSLYTAIEDADLLSSSLHVDPITRSPQSTPHQPSEIANHTQHIPPTLFDAALPIVNAMTPVTLHHPPPPPPPAAHAFLAPTIDLTPPHVTPQSTTIRQQQLPQQRLPARTAPAASTTKARWVDLYDQKSDVDSADSGREEGSGDSDGQVGRRHRNNIASSDSSSSSSRSHSPARRRSSRVSRVNRTQISSVTRDLEGLSEAEFKEVQLLLKRFKETRSNNGGGDGSKRTERRSHHRSMSRGSEAGQIEGKRADEHTPRASPSASSDDESSPRDSRDESGYGGSYSHLDSAPPPPKGVMSSPGIGLPSLGMQRNWNAEFQECFTAVCNDATILDNVVGYSALSALAHDFLWTASTLGKIIISEMQLPEHQRTIPSIDVGGYAGGMKYIAHNILFKFAVDNADGLYGGDQFAAKAAGHELLGLSHYYRTIASSEGRLGLHVPLTALIDFRGYRLYAICKLPIDGAKTLILGSHDGGHHILNTNTELDKKMRSVAEVLNLKVHTVTDGTKQQTSLPSCFDIEGHLGKDGRFYLIDYHRTFPPEPPSNLLQQQLKLEGWIPPTIPTTTTGTGQTARPYATLATLHQHQSKTVLKNTYLYRLLRPELVRSYTASPLSSDVYSQFDRDPENYRHVLLCYQGLIERVIPTFAKALELNPPPSKFVDSGVRMQQQTANMIRTSSGGGGANGKDRIHTNNNNSTVGTPSAAGVPIQSPHLSRSPSISSMVAPLPTDGSGSSIGGGMSSNLQHPLSHYLPPPTLTLDVLSSVLHQSGINVRYLGMVRSHMSCPSWRSVLLVEIVARLLKNELRSRWRQIRVKSMSDGPFRGAAVQFINLIFFPSLASNTFWSEHLHAQVNLHYPGTLVGEEVDPKLWNLKANLTSNASSSSSSSSGAGSGGGSRTSRSNSSFTPSQRSRSARTNRPSSASTCPIHHSTHVHVGVDPADPLAFLPPLNAQTAVGGTTETTTNTTINANPPSTTTTSSATNANPDFGRSPSLPLAPPGTSTGVPRSVSTSVGYVKQASHLPHAVDEHTTTTGGHNTNTTAPHTPQKKAGSYNASSTSGAPAGGGHRKPRSILDPAPDIPCSGDGCCHPNGGTDYFLLLFMRFIQLSGIVLEEGVMEAIQGAAEKQSQASPDPVGVPDLQRQNSSGLSSTYEDDLVGEGSLQLDRTGVGHGSWVSSKVGSSSAVIGPPGPLGGHRSTTEPRLGLTVPPSPPMLTHALSTKDMSFPSLAQAHAAPSPIMVTSRHVKSPSTSGLVGMRTSSSASSLVSPIHHTPTPPPAIGGWRGSGLFSGVGGGYSSASSSAPQTPPSASGRNTPHGSDAMEGFPRSRSGSIFTMANGPSTPAHGGVGGGSSSIDGRSSGVESKAYGEIWNLWSWPFVAPLEDMHIRGLVEKVKQVNLLWYAEGTSLLIKAWQKLQQHNRWIAEQSSSTTSTTSSSGSSSSSSSSKKRFFLPGHLQSDEVFRDSPTPFLKMSFHLAGLAANKYQQALKYSLNDPLTLCNLSFLMSAVYNKYASAMSYLKRAIQANPMHVRSYYYLGQLFQYHLHDYPQARACYEKALALAPHYKHANTLKDYGNLMHYGFNNPTEAALKYKKALEVEPSHIKSLQLLANLTSRTCDTLREHDAIKKLLYAAARSPMGVVETRLNAQEKYIHFLVMQAELYAEEHIHALQHPHAHQPPHGTTPTNNLVEASKRWREAIDFLQCPHVHYGSSRDDGASDNASGTVINQAMANLTLPPPANTTHTAAGGGTSTAIRFMVSSTVIKPAPHTASHAPPSRTPSATSAAAAAAADTEPPPTPAAGFSWCVCADCCAVNTDALPLADTLLSYAQFIYQYESLPPTGLTPSQSQSHIASKLIESEKWFQWSILVHHTLITSRKKHRQVQMKYEMHPEAMQDNSTSQMSDNQHTSNTNNMSTSMSTSINKKYTTHHASLSSSAHEILSSSGPLTQSTYSFVPPAVKTAYLMTAPPFPPDVFVTDATATPQHAAPSTPAVTTTMTPSSSSVPSVSSASNASVLLDSFAPFLIPSYLGSFSIVPNFRVIVSRPNPVQPKLEEEKDEKKRGKAQGELERRLRSMGWSGKDITTGIGTGGGGGGVSVFSSIGSPSSASSLSSSVPSSSAGPPPLSRPPSSWDSTDPKKWSSLPAVIPATTPNAAGGAGASKVNRQLSSGNGALHPTAAMLGHGELVGSELSLEIDLEFDGSIERACECEVDHSFGESATACSCTFANPRYLVSYAFFLLRIGRPAQAAYVFQSALVLHPFGRTGSTCFARMIDSCVRSGMLASGPNYANNVQIVYSLYRKAVGFDSWGGAAEGSTNNDTSDTSATERHTFLASLTAATLFQSFLNEHSNAVGPIASAPSTPTSVSSNTSANSSIGVAPGSTSTSAPSIGPLLKGVDVCIARVHQLVDSLRAEMTATVTAFKNSSTRHAGSPSFALALVNTACKCRRPTRGKMCLCKNQVLKSMIQKTQQMRTKLENKRKAQLGEFRHHDAASHRHAKSGTAVGTSGGRASSSATIGSGGRATLTRVLTKRDSADGMIPSVGSAPPNTITSTSTEAELNAPLREGSGKWAQLVVKSAASDAAASIPKRTFSNNNAVSVSSSSAAADSSSLPKRTPSNTKDSSRDKSGGDGRHIALRTPSHGSSHSGQSTPTIATPIAASPILAPHTAPIHNPIHHPVSSSTLALPPGPVVTTPTSVSLGAGPVPTPFVLPPSGMTLLPTSQWKAPPTLANATNTAPTTLAPAGQTNLNTAPPTPIMPSPFHLLTTPNAPTTTTPTTSASASSSVRPASTPFTFFSPPPPSASTSAGTSHQLQSTVGSTSLFKQSTLGKKR